MVKKLVKTPFGSVWRADSEAVLAWSERSEAKRPTTSEPRAGRGENERTEYSRAADQSNQIMNVSGPPAVIAIFVFFRNRAA